MHPLIREFALDRLRQDRALNAAVRRAHGDYFLTLARSNFAAARGPDQGRLLETIVKENANLAAAWRNAMEDGRSEDLRPFVEPIFYALAFRGMFREAQELFSYPSDGSLRAYLLSVLANCLVHQGEFEAAEAIAQESLAQGESGALEVGHAHQALANIAHARGQAALARVHYERALSARSGAGDAIGASFTTVSLAWLHVQTGDLRAARPWVKESFRLCQRAGNLGGVVLIHACAGELAEREGRFEDALECFQKALKVEEQVQQPQQRASTLIKLGGLLASKRELTEAQAAFEEAQSIALRCGDKRIAGNAALGLARVKRLVGEHASARVASLAVLKQSHALKLPVQSAGALFELARIALACGEAGEAARSIALAGSLETPNGESETTILCRELPPGYPLPVIENYEDEVLTLLNEPVLGALRI